MLSSLLHFGALLLKTIALRPYVFVFLAAYLVSSAVNFGISTTVAFTVLTYLLSFACEWSSVHNGFPFGLYHYIPATVGRELWVAGVPFMDSLSFTFLAFASYSTALLLTVPHCWRGADFRLLDTRRLRRLPRVALLGALFMVMVDFVVDPLSVQGDKWFLGRIFFYDPPGPHFGVPISNYLGWFMLAVIAIVQFQLLDARITRRKDKPIGVAPRLPSRALLGPALYLGIVAFGITMLFRIGATTVAWASVFLFLPLLALAAHILTLPRLRGDMEDLRRHLEDFPYDAPCAHLLQAQTTTVMPAKPSIEMRRA